MIKKEEAMAQNTFLDYYKTVLQKVSFDEFLLNKEYKKARHMIHPSEISKLDEWIHKVGLKHKISECDELKQTG